MNLVTTTYTNLVPFGPAASDNEPNLDLPICLAYPEYGFMALQHAKRNFRGNKEKLNAARALKEQAKAERYASGIQLGEGKGSLHPVPASTRNERRMLRTQAIKAQKKEVTRAIAKKLPPWRLAEQTTTEGTA